MNKIALFGFSALVFIAGCFNQNQMLVDDEPMALQTAVSRGRFDMNCPAASGEVLSREVVQPAMQGPWVDGINRAEYTIGVSGCDRRKSYIVVCPQGGNGCFATGPGPFHGKFM